MIVLLGTSATLILLFTFFVVQNNSQRANSYYSSPNFFKPRFIPGTAMGVSIKLSFV